MRIVLMDVIVVALHVVTFRYAFKWLKNYWCDSQVKCETDTDSDFMELLTFYSRFAECKMCHSLASTQCKSPECSYLKTQRMIEILGRAEKSLDICIYFFTYEGFYRKLVDLHHSGVKVRIIIDSEMGMDNSSRLHQLKEKGVDVRMSAPFNVMHHKFFIIDNKLFVTGSLNWTMHALLNNTEHVLITNKKDFVEKSGIVFEKLWDKSIQPS